MPWLQLSLQALWGRRGSCLSTPKSEADVQENTPMPPRPLLFPTQNYLFSSSSSTFSLSRAVLTFPTYWDTGDSGKTSGSSWNLRTLNFGCPLPWSPHEAFCTPSSDLAAPTSGQARTHSFIHTREAGWVAQPAGCGSGTKRLAPSLYSGNSTWKLYVVFSEKDP